MQNKFIGNVNAMEQISLYLDAFMKRGEPLPDFGIFGPYGVGKTYLTRYIKEYLNSEYKYISATALKTNNDTVRVIEECREQVEYSGGKPVILCIDEAHALTKKVSTSFLSLLEQPRQLQYISNEQIYTDTIDFNLCINLCSSNDGQMDKALLSRLIQVRLQEYSDKDKMEICSLHTDINNEPIKKKICDVSRNIRHMKQLIDALHKLKKNRSLDDKTAIKILYEIYDIDTNGMFPNERNYLKYLTKQNKASLSSISSYLDLDKAYVMDHIEPYLIKNKLILRMSRGRQITQTGKRLVANLSKGGVTP